MKLISVCTILMLGVLSAHTQTINDYALMPGSAITLSAGEKVTLIVQRTDNAKNKAMPVGADPVWTINGHDLNHLQPDDGKLSFPGLNVYQAAYEAPATVPAKNPVMVSVGFRPNEKTGAKDVGILLCAITIADAYTIEGTIDMDAPMIGMSMQLQINDHVRYTVPANGAAMLEPVNGKGSIHVKVTKGTRLEKNGALGKYQSPMEYDIPVLISVDKPQAGKSSSATFYVKSFSSPDNNETYLITANGVSQTLKQNIIDNTMRNVFMTDVVSADIENVHNGLANIEWANHMEAIRSKSPNELTAQDKKDIAQMQALQQKLGEHTSTQNPFSDVPLGDGSTVGNNGKLTTQGAKNLQHQAPASAIGNGAGSMNVHCTFNPQSSTVLEINKEGNDYSNVYHAKIHLVVKKDH